MKTGAIFGAFLMLWQIPTSAMDLQEYLRTVESKHKTIMSLDAAKESAEERKIGADIDLSPVLTADLGYVNDQSPLGQFASFGATESKTTSYSLGLAKKFSTGTNVSVTASNFEVENTGISAAQYSRLQKFGVGTLGVGISQSLWKDFFGSATRLRWQRQEAATSAETGTYDLQKKLLLVNAEAAYWDYIYGKESLKIGRESLERAKRIEAWTRRRVNDGISDRADLLQAQALVAARQLQLVSSEDEMTAAKRKVRDFLELTSSDAMPELNGDISTKRSLDSMLVGKKGKVVALDAYLASLDAKAKSLAAQEVEDQMLPDLILSGAYNTNAFEQDMAQASSHLLETDRPTTKVGLKFVYPFDIGAKGATSSSARKAALSARLQSERKSLEGESAWIEINRRYVEMSKRIEWASEISKLQSAAAKAQTDLFNKGRSITANVITAEEEAGNAELNLTKLKSEQRKMEAQGRLFIALED